MKYNFNNYPDKNPTEVELNSFQLIIRERGHERIIPYSAITDVRLEHRKDHYLMSIQSLDFGSIQISNRLLSSSRQWQDQSRQYQTFVRVFHLHLSKAQCLAEFCAGFRPNSIVIKLILLTVFSFLVYFVEDYFNILSIHPLLTAFITLGIGAFLLLAPYLRNFPKSYNPSDIPLNMLPPTR
jgi:hypothetical protein